MSGPTLGVADRIGPGDEDRVGRLMERLRALGVSDLRLEIRESDGSTDEGRGWTTHLLSRLAAGVRILPNVVFAAESAPSQVADVVEEIIENCGATFDDLELRGEPAQLEAAADRARRLGKRVVVGGLDLFDAARLEVLSEQGAFSQAHVVGFQARLDSAPEIGPALVRARRILESSAPDVRLWVTEAGYSTWRHDEFQQVEAFLEALSLPIDRVYWYSSEDADSADERGQSGLWTSAGRPKLLARLWSDQGLSGVRGAVRLGRGPAARARRPVLITGGAGFVGTNLADRLLESGRPVVVYDSLSRPGTEENLKWLRHKHGRGVEVVISDVRDVGALRPVVGRASAVIHLAAQVAVTSSLTDPVHDFEVNAGGTFGLVNLLSGRADPPPLVFTSTNKVYGRLDDLRLTEESTRYVPEDGDIRARGIDEDRPLDFHSPYGCSKGAADQYVLDFARNRSLPATVFRMSCIYGPHQCGSEDQGWVCHFLRRVLEGAPLTVYGTGKQVRDVLYVDDLTDAVGRVLRHPSVAAGRAFNIGGGPENALSLLELIAAMKELHHTLPPVRYAPWRAGDQRYFVADAGRFGSATGWRPRVSAAAGIESLYRWLRPRRHAPSSAPTLRRKSS
jgi:CDP-paratose 2-epimerase